MNLTRWERFKDARTVHNQHGDQTMEQVHAATGVTGGKIQALEDDEQDRDVGYTSVAKLAAHYNVSADYLLGFTNDPNPKGTAIDDLGISPAVANRFKDLKNKYFLEDLSSKINLLLDNDAVWHLLYLLADYITAAKADKIYEEILPKHQHRKNEDALTKELLTIAEQHHATDSELYDFLQAKAKSIDLGGLLSTLGMENFSLKDLLSAKVKSQLEETLYSLERGENIGID